PSSSIIPYTPRTFYSSSSFLFNDTAPTEIYTLSLHDALPILPVSYLVNLNALRASAPAGTPLTFALYIDDACTTEVDVEQASSIDRKSTRLNSSHDQISYAVFCLKKKKQHQRITTEYQ